jgi:diguanylate cyclase (GGDEF)-like protein
MGQWVSQPGSGIAYLGIALFVLLGVYAGLLLNADRLPRWLRLRSPAGLRSRLTIALILVATLPAISLALVLSDRASRQRADQAAASLHTQADGAARGLAYLVEKTRFGVVTLAQHIARAGAFSTDTAARQLQTHHASAVGVESMAAVRRDGTVVAATFMAGSAPLPFAVTGGRLSATAFLEEALRAPLPRISNAEREPLVGRHRTILISAPVHAPDGTPWGMVLAAFDPARVPGLRAAFREELAGGLVVTDENLEVLLAAPSTGPALKPGDIENAMAGSPHGESLHFTLRSADGTTEDFIGAQAAAGETLRVMRFAPAHALHGARLQEYGVAMGWLLAALIISVCLAVGLAASISGPLSALDLAVRQFDPELDREPPKAPVNAPREVMVVFEHLATLQERLRQSYAQLRQSFRHGERLRGQLIDVIENRDQEIEGRTQELQQANAALSRLSRSDMLTGVANRRACAEFLERAWRNALREQRPLSLLMIDIDHFTAYNDTYGRAKGDICLKALAEVISGVTCRASDLVARYGGEEFVVVLGNTPLEGALQVAEEIRAAVQELAIPHRGAPRPGILTVSVGVTSTVPSRGSTADSCLTAADRAMSAAKEQGRNQVGYSMAAHTGLFQSLCLPNDPAAKLS